MENRSIAEEKDIFSITQDNERVVAEGDKEDRFSYLPRNVIDRILELLPAHDAARTSVLSKKWRYTWSMLPYLILDDDFCDNLADSLFKQTVDEILLQHHGDIVKFLLIVPETFLSPYTDIDRWMGYVTRNGVKKLTLIMREDTYKLPSYIFNCPTLTSLALCSCIFKLPSSFVGFHNLTILTLEAITFVPTKEFCDINVPLLVSLDLGDCNGTQYLKIVSPQLESLYTCEINYLVLNCFMNCRKLRKLQLRCFQVFDNPKHDERITVEKLLLSLPALNVLHLDSFYLELLSADTVPKELPFMLSCMWQLWLGVDFGLLGQTSYTLQLIKGSPNLSELEILVKSNGEDVDAVLKYLNTPNCLDRPLNKLKYVVIDLFKCSQAELLFVKLLFARTPSLVRMTIKHGGASRFTRERNITRELMHMPRASPKAEIFSLPYAF